MIKMARLSRELLKMLIRRHMAALRKTGGKPVSAEVLESLDSIRGVLTPLNEARKRELFEVACKAISDIDRIARALGFKIHENVDLSGERSGLFLSRSAGLVLGTMELPEDVKPIDASC